MESAIGAATGLVGSVVNLLSNELVGAYVASTELGLNSVEIKKDLLRAQALLQEAQTRGAKDNHGLKGLLQELTVKADEAEDALDELHYFIIQDQLDGTRYAVPDLGDDLRGHARHGRHAIRHVVGNCLACFSCSSTMKDDDSGGGRGAAAVPINPLNATKTDSAGQDGPVEKLKFHRVAMSKKIKSVMEELHSLCEPVSKLLCITPHQGSTETAVNLNRPPTGSISAQHTLYGRADIFEGTKDDITSGRFYTETLSVLPVVGPGGIGKTTFAQYLYNDKRIQEHFAVRVWVCVSTDFDVLKLSQQILSCIQGSNSPNQTTSLDQLQISIAEKIMSKRFLIVFDDMWKCSNQGWEDLLAPLRKGETKGNMVLVTTRFPSIAEMVKTTPSIPLKGLESDEFFRFFEAFIFDEKKPEYQGDLASIAQTIAKKLKGSPLAGKTVGRLLRKEISRKHWMEVLENNKWQNQENDDGIMTSLRISYDYLPSHLKKCFQYFALFPEDYKFKNLEITYFWIAIGIIEKDEDYMEQLVENGFLVKENAHWSSQQYYVLHDLLHELSRCVSSQECLNIYDSKRFKADAVPKSIHHLSITIEDNYDVTFTEEMIKLKSKVDIANLRALMIFRRYGETIGEILNDTFKDVEGLRVLFIVVQSPNSFPCDFSKLIHLRYLKLGTWDEVTLPSTLSRLYHLKLLDLSGWHGSYELPRDTSRLISLCHFIAGKKFHCNIAEVGKLKCLKELKEFHVMKESVGYELCELGQLTDLGGELCIRNLEKVTTKDEAMEAKLESKGDLKGLGLVWGSSDAVDGTTKLVDVLDALQPHPYLAALGIIGHGGTSGPSWLCGDINFELLEYLHLEGVSWVTLPPFEYLPQLTSLTLSNIYEVSEIRHVFGGATNKSFLQLKLIVLDSLPELIEWVGVPNDSFARLETIYCRSCPNLRTLPFLREYSAGCYNHLSKLEIFDCPKLSLPPMPHSSTLIFCHVRHSSAELTYSAGNNMYINGYNSGEVDLHNLRKVEKMSITDVSHISMTELNNLKSLRRLDVRRCSFTCHGLQDLVCLQYLTVYNCGVFFPWPTEAAHTIKLFPASLETLEIEGESGMQSMALLSNLKSLRRLDVRRCSITCHGLQDLACLQSLTVQDCGNFFPWPTEAAHTVNPFPHTIKPFPASLETLEIEGELGMQPVALLSNLKSLRRLDVRRCSITCHGLQDLACLQSVTVKECGNFFLRPIEAAHTIINPLPASLEELEIDGESSMESMALLSNLTCLTDLILVNSENLTVDGFNPLITVNLNSLKMYNRGNCLSRSISADLLSELAVARTNLLPPAGSYQLRELTVDCISAVLVAPICSLLAATLHTLEFWYDHRAESFTEEEERALQLLTSLCFINFMDCPNLLCLPQGLHSLPSLKTLFVQDCPKIRSLDKGDFPTSLECLLVQGCSPGLQEQAKKLKGTEPDFNVILELE
uniref:Powdery mildew resistance protein n=1 Tax=Triticum urartu TaxID=4572 RepID=A0A2I6STE0_TRIUA|nr:powdery mildew resistance protein [Triticum urartu]